MSVSFTRLAVAIGSISAIAPLEAASVVWSAAAGGNNHSYEVVLFTAADTNKTWDGARLLAEQRGGYLATLTTAAENAFVTSLISDPKYWYFLPSGFGSIDFWDGPWIGGYQLPGSREPDGGWVWVTGELFSYNNWHPEQPDDLFGGNTQQNRLHFWDKGNKPTFADVDPTWDDVRPGTNWIPAYVVEYVPEVSSSLIFASLACFQVLRRKRE